jgi:hypothetical protein
VFPADNPIDPAMLSERRAKRAEIAEEQLQDQLAQARREIDRLQGRADALSGELEIARDRRDETAREIDGLKRDLRYSHQREHSERQLRIETQDALAQAQRDAMGAGDDLQAELREAYQRAEEFERELRHRRRDADVAQGLIARHEVARARAEQAAHGADDLRAELDRRDELQTAFAEQMQGLRDEVEAMRERFETDHARLTLAQTAMHDVMAAAARMRERLERAELLRAEAQERLALTREQLGERDEQYVRATRQLEAATVEVASLRAQLHSERERTASALDAAGAPLRAHFPDQAAAKEQIAVLQTMLDEVVAITADVRARYEREADRVQAQIDAERDRHEADRARLEAQRTPPPEPERQEQPPPPAAADAASVIADLSRAAQRLRETAEPPEAHDDEPQEDEHWQPVPGRRPAEPVSPWLTPALTALGQTDAATATEILVALLALQGRTGQTLLYELTIPGSGMWRVSVHHDMADIARDARRSYDGSAAFHIIGGPQDVAVLAGGGPTGLGAGAKLKGKRRQLRKLLRAGRDPVGLADAVLLLDPGQALALLAAAPAAAGMRDQELAVQLRAIAPGDSETTWYAIADAGGLRTGAGPLPADAPAARAVMRGSPADIVALLGGASSHGVSVAGDIAVARAMMDLLTAIQRV